MRALAIPSLVILVTIVTLAFLWSEWTSGTAAVRRAMERHGLTAGNIAYGSAGAKPALVAVNAPEAAVRPYYSLSKPITAAVAIQVLDLDQIIEGGTVRQLLQHTGGWDRASAGDPVTQGSGGSDCTKLQVPEKQFEPGERYAYSNLGYCVLGRAVSERTGKPYQEIVTALLPETGSMAFDPQLGPAGGWSGTASDYYRFASRRLPDGTEDDPISRPNNIPYGLGWAIGPDFVTHFGALRTNFSIVVKRGDFVAVGTFDGRPRDDDAAARDLRSALLELSEEN